MIEQENIQDKTVSVEEPTFTDARRLEMMSVKAVSVIRQCQRKNIQPREMLLKAFESKERTDDVATKLYLTAFGMISRMPNYDLDKPDEFNKAKKDITAVFNIFIGVDFDAQDLEEQARRDGWVKVGMLAYELGEDYDIFLHVPPMEGRPGLHQLKDSLCQIAEFLKQNPNIQAVRGSSLLLEHPIAKRLGFEIDAESDEGASPNFKMSRGDFLEKFGK
jgi:hypothetical protein